VYVGSFIDFMLAFNMLPARPAFESYVGPLRERPAYIRAKAIDNALIAETQGATAP
jgi:glutathione S-transferase